MANMNIAPLAPMIRTQPGQAVKPEAVEKGEGSFGQWLKESLSEVNKMQNESNDAAQKLISGESKDIHGTMITMQKAGIEMELVMQIRNKVIAAYDEIKRMQF